MTISTCIFWKNKEVIVCLPFLSAKEHLTGNSLGFHEHMGFTLVGVLPKCGYQFGCWYGTAHLNKALGTYPTPAVPIWPFPEIRSDFEAWLREQTAPFKG